jgi:hypothetical protein
LTDIICGLIEIGSQCIRYGKKLKRFFTKKKIFTTILLLIGLGAAAFLYQNQLLNVYFRLTPLFHWGYAQDKALVAPYFDEVFYRREYEVELKKSGQEPLDHFMQRSTRLGGGDYDPNPWFNVTLYKERLWPCSGNPFVDFLRQPPLKVPENAQPVAIYANAEQLTRAWMAVEGFMRMQKFKVVLILPESFKDHIPLRFQPMVNRGLLVQFSKDPDLSFYQSPFLKNPDSYGLTELPIAKVASGSIVTHVQRRPGYEYRAHCLSNSRWKKKGRINPCMLNFARACDEPIEYSRFGSDEYSFKKTMRRLASAFDLMFINSDIGTENSRVVPGYMASWIDPKEIPAEKKYEISFLLSMGPKGMDSFRTKGSFIYHFRKIVWENEKKLDRPTKFYLSRRHADKFPKELKDRALPTDSKKWIFGSQFTIAIENSKQENYFSEKLLGPFLALSVPIYIGCPNIKDYFDERGMLIAKDPEDVIRIAQSLTPETYEKMLPYLLENKKRAEKLLTLEENYIDAFGKSLQKQENICLK